MRKGNRERKRGSR